MCSWARESKALTFGVLRAKFCIHEEESLTFGKDLGWNGMRMRV